MNVSFAGHFINNKVSGAYIDWRENDLGKKHALYMITQATSFLASAP